MKKLIAIIMVLIICMPLCACGDEKIETKNDAIQAVVTEMGLMSSIHSPYGYVAYRLGFKEYDTKSIEKTWKAAKNEMGVWEVTCSGTMTGKTATGEKQTYKFVVTATVADDGRVRDFKFQKKY